jgi:hypothetical protein
MPKLQSDNFWKNTALRGWYAVENTYLDLILFGI